MLDAELIRRLAGRIESHGGQPVNRLLVNEVWLAVVRGELGTGERLPTARHVAVELGVSPRSVEQAYEELEARGVVANRPGEGTFVSLRPPPEEEQERYSRFAELCRETYSRARDLGFGVNELIDRLAEYRGMERSGPSME